MHETITNLIKIQNQLKDVDKANFINSTKIDPSLLSEFYKSCIYDLNLDIIGIMCLPPIENDNNFYFHEMTKLIKKISAKELSMGMSSDYLTAFISGASFLRIGSKIFGKRA